MITKNLILGELTEKGFHIKQASLWDRYQKYLQENHQEVFQGRGLLSVIRMQNQPIRKENTLSLVDVDLDNVIRAGSEPERNLPWERLGVFKKLKEVLAGP